MVICRIYAIHPGKDLESKSFCVIFKFLQSPLFKYVSENGVLWVEKKLATKFIKDQLTK